MKNKMFIPLVSSVLLLFSCGNNPSKPEPTPDPPIPETVIKVNSTSRQLEGEAVFSESFSAAMDEFFSFEVSFETVKDSLLNTPISWLFFENTTGTVTEPPEFFNTNKDILVSYNGVTLSKSPLSWNEFVEKIQASSYDDLEGSFAYGSLNNLMSLIIVRKNRAKTDNVVIKGYSSNDFISIRAMFQFEKN